MTSKLIIKGFLLNWVLVSGVFALDIVKIPWNHLAREATFKVVQKYIPENPVIVDAGAFDGLDTGRMKKLWPTAIIHAFEPDPYNFKKMLKNLAGLEGIYKYELAISDKNGIALFNQSDDPRRTDNAQSGSLLAPKEHLVYSDVKFDTQVPVKTVTLDDWAQENNVERVDMLWLDMQGYELFALKHGLNVLKNVKIIHTEVEFVEAYAGQPLYQEVLTWLTEQGFVVVARDFEPGDPKRWYGNILVVRQELIKE